MDELISYRQELLFALERDIDELTCLGSTLSENNGHRSSDIPPHSPHYLLFHLWVLETHEFTVQIQYILEADLPRLEFFDDEAWMANHYSPKEPIQVIIQDTARLLSNEIALLCELPLSAWSRAARHPRWGVHTLQWWVELQHEVTIQHMQEVKRLLAA